MKALALYTIDEVLAKGLALCVSAQTHALATGINIPGFDYITQNFES